MAGGIQTTYGFSYEVLQPGYRHNSTNLSARTCYSDEIIPVGIGVALDTTDVGLEGRAKVKVPTVTGDVFVGIACATHKESTNETAGLGDLDSNAVTQYEPGDDITVDDGGVQTVLCVDTIADLSSDVYWYFEGANAGNFGANANASAKIVPGLKWRSVVTGPAPAKVKLDTSLGGA